MIDQRAKKFLDSLKPIGRNALLAPYRNFDDLMSLSDATSIADYEERCRRINEAATKRWAADFMAKYHHPDPAAPLLWSHRQSNALPPTKPLFVLDEAADSIERPPDAQPPRIGVALTESPTDANCAIAGQAEPPPTAPERQETWRDRPPML